MTYALKRGFLTHKKTRRARHREEGGEGIPPFKSLFDFTPIWFYPLFEHVAES